MKKRYWSRGGIAGLLAAVVLGIGIAIKDIVIHGYVMVSLATPMWEQTLLATIQNVSGLRLLHQQDFLGTQPTELGNYVVWGIMLIGPFIVGSILGWIYGKIKNKDNSSVQ
jgi:hypothetical protein